MIALLAEDKYTSVVHGGGTALINDSLVELESRFSGLVLRVHRSALVMRNRVRGLERSADGHHRVILDGTDISPEVSRRKLSSVRKLIGQLT